MAAAADLRGAAAPLLALRTLIGLDVVGRRLRSRPIQSKFGKPRLRNVTVRGSYVDAPKEIRYSTVTVFARLRG